MVYTKYFLLNPPMLTALPPPHWTGVHWQKYLGCIYGAHIKIMNPGSKVLGTDWKCFDFGFVQIVECLEIHKWDILRWDPSLHMKFTYVSHTAYTHRPKVVSCGVFSAPEFWLRPAIIRGQLWPSCILLVLQKFQTLELVLFLDYDFLRLYQATTGHEIFGNMFPTGQE